MAYYLPQPNMPSGRVSYDDCKRTREWSPIDGIRKGDVVDARSPDRAFTWRYPTVGGYEGFDKQIRYQDDAVGREGKGRRVFQCVPTTTDATILKTRYRSELPHIIFRACHLGKQ